MRGERRPLCLHRHRPISSHLLLLLLLLHTASTTAFLTTHTTARALQRLASRCPPRLPHQPQQPQHRCLTRRRAAMPTSDSPAEALDRDGNPSTAAKVPKDRKKRRVALVLGYVGTNYSGLQKSETGPGEADVVTIESVLEKALFDSGYIRESNYGDLEKIGWARCSRTDKGVHAARNVVSAKLELWQNDMEGEQPYWSERAVAEINAYLPDDIRVHSCAKVTKSFRPRDAVSFREYEYIVPLELLRPFDETRRVQHGDEDSLVARFCELLSRYQGTHNFHNFTKIKSRDLIRRLKAKVGNSRGWVHKDNRNVDGENAEGDAAVPFHAAAAAPAAEEEPAEEEGEDDDWTAPTMGGLATAKVDGIRRFNTGVALNPLFQILRASPQNQRASNNPDRRKTWAERNGGAEGNDKDDLRVEHVTIGDPGDGLTTALWDLTRYQGVLKMVRTNIYRCEGRRLEVDGKQFVAVTFHGSSFLYNQIRLLIGGAIGVATGLLPETALDMALDSPYLLYSPLAPAEGLYLRHITFGRKSKNPVVMHEADLPSEEEMRAINCPQVYALLSNQAAERAEEFERRRIQIQVNKAWTAELQEDWRNYARLFAVSPEVEKSMTDKFEQWRESMQKLEETKAARELFRRQSMVSWMEREGRNFAEEQGNTGGTVGEVEKEIFRSYRKWMPQRFATDLIIRFRLKPGKQVANVQRGLAMGIASGRVPTSATTEELFELMEREGGVGYWEEEGAKVRGGRGEAGDEEEEEEEVL